MAAKAIEKCRLVAKNKPSIVEQCLKFFGVASPDDWEGHYSAMQVSFRRSREDQSDIAAISAWLRIGEIEAEKFDGPKYDRDKFSRALHDLRLLTIESAEEFQPKMHKLFRDAGVAFVLVPAIPRSHVSGVARWLNPHRPLIQMSLYGKTNDKFWFTLFHESAHILLHAKDKKSVYLDDPGKHSSSDPNEVEANQWAGDFTIPADQAHRLPDLKTRDAVRSFAQSIGIHPGIVVGRLQHDLLIDVSWMNDLKESFRFVEGE
jgi:HTH-type transcriptional regulator/antitoxin HigA